MDKKDQRTTEINPTTDVVQFPKSLKIEDLPRTVTVDVEFEVDGTRYVLVEEKKGGLQICEEDGPNTTEPKTSGRFYVIKRV